MIDQFVLKTLKDQHKYLRKQGYKSYDLCDISSKPYFLKVNEFSQHKTYGKYIKYPHNLLQNTFSSTLRRLYHVKKQDFAQSNAFIVRGLLRLSKTTSDEDYLAQALPIISRIDEQKSIGFKYLCWGQPYDWFSGKIIPAFTPRTTVTSQVGRMFLDAYSITQEPQYLDSAIEIGNFFLEEMPLSYDQNDATCYAYTTIDTLQVHNPNMMVAGFLTLLWHFTKEKRYLNRALSAAKFTFSRLNTNGSWYYKVLENNTPSKIDNYHTGYNIEGGMIMLSYLSEKFPYKEELKVSIAYYLKHLFSPAGLPYLTNTKKFPIDIQCCAQSIITYVMISQLDEKYLTAAHHLFKWTVNNMYEKGSYYYRVFENGSKDKTDYVRWGDAWMLYAGSLLLNADHA